ncbi:ArsR/SmtB family transcription factor [Flavitalea flava]
MELQIAEIANVIGEPVRAKILWALLDGRAYTATELAIFAEASPQNTSMHLKKLIQADFLMVTSQGRHRYYRYANDTIAYAIEALANLIPGNKKKSNSEDAASGVKYCRTCYDHLAGKIGVSITEALLQKHIITETANNYLVSDSGVKWFLAMHIDIAILKEKKRLFAKPCLDWSERRYHMAGALGASMLEKMLASDWIRKVKNSRAVIISSKGEKELYKSLGIEV